MRILVADASALIEYLLRTPLAGPVEKALRAPDVDVHVPSLCDVEMAAALRRGLLQGTISEGRARDAVEDYLDLPLTRHGHQSLMGRVLALRRNFSAYDATYVALAEGIGGRLLTADGSLARAVRAHVGIATVPI